MDNNALFLTFKLFLDFVATALSQLDTTNLHIERELG